MTKKTNDVLDEALALASEQKQKNLDDKVSALFDFCKAKDMSLVCIVDKGDEEHHACAIGGSVNSLSNLLANAMMATPIFAAAVGEATALYIDRKCGRGKNDGDA